MIVAHQLSRQFGRFTAVDALDLEVPRGVVAGFLGPNGAGKTTTIRMICGYLPSTRGSVRVDGLDVSRQWREVRRRIGYLPEAAPSYAEMRVSEYLTLRAKLFSVPRAKRRTAIDRAVNRCWLEDVRERPIHQLSKGYRQRVGLAAALLHEPPVLILDEPTVGLDPAQIREVRSLIRELAGEHTILLSTHILPEVELTCDRIIMIARGRIRAHGTLEELHEAASRERRYVVETNAANAINALQTVPGVRAVRSATAAENNGYERLEVTAQDGVGDLRETIAATLHATGGLTRELHRDTPSLEQLYLRTIEEEFSTDGHCGPRREA